MVLPLANNSGKSQPALGLLQDCAYQTSSSTLGRHDLVMLFTDGLYEVQNTGGDLYTQALLTDGVQKHASLAAPRLFDALLMRSGYSRGRTISPMTSARGCGIRIKNPFTKFRNCINNTTKAVASGGGSAWIR